jgi:TP901 family phage tail tape measure protein
MTAQPVEANVVLTSDNTQYDQAMMTSAGSTDNLGKSIDTLGQKINNLTKTAGKGLIGISAADVALIGTATAAWASYEKQMSRLQAQSAILTRTNSSQERVMKDYTAAVKGLRTEYGTTTAEASKLVEVLSKVTNVRSTRQMGDLSKVFVDMSKATGESSEGLASSLTNLQKIMGTPINAKTSRDYADTFTYLSAQTQTSAQGLVDFTAQIAPMAEQMGMSHKQVAGFAAGFARAGQEGFAAATVFNKATNDITKAIATGGPELRQYANIVGRSVEDFQSLSSADQVLAVFEALQKQGDAATSTLERLGLEGPRTAKAIAAISREPGGLRGAVNMAESPAAVGTSSEAAAEAMDNLGSKFEELREELKMTAESLATLFGPAVTKFIGVLEAITENVNEVMSGPFGELVQVIMAVVAPLAGGAGAMLLFAGAILKVAAAFGVMRSSMGYGFREGMGGGPGITKVRGPDGKPIYLGAGGGELSKRGEQIATGGRYGQVMGYNLGQTVGATGSGAAAMIREGWMAGRERFNADYVRPTQSRSMASYAAGGLGRGIDAFLTPQFDQMRYANPAMRTPWLAQVAPTARLADRVRLGGQMGAVALAEQQLKSVRGEEAKIGRDPFLSSDAREARLAELKTIREDTKERLNSARASERVTRESIAATEATAAQTRETRGATEGTARLNKSLRGLGGGVVGGALGGARAGAGFAAQQIAAHPRGAAMGGGMLAMAGMGAMGVESNTLMMGALGTTIAPGWGTAIGAGLGATIDIAKANDDLFNTVNAVNDQAKDYATTGTGLADLGAASDKAQAKIDKTTKDFEVGSHEYMFDLGTFIGSTKSTVEGWVGSSDIEEAQRTQDEQVAKQTQTADVIKRLAEASGVQITGTEKQQREQIDAFMADQGAAALSESGYDIDTLVAKTAVGQLFGMSGDDLIKEIAAPGAEADLEGRLTRAGGVGAALYSGVGEQARMSEGDITLFYKATNDIFNTAVKSGKSYLDIMKEAEQAQSEIGVENSREYELMMAISGKAQQAMQMQAPQIGRVGAFQQTLGIGQMLQTVTPTTAEESAQLDQAKATNIQAVGDQISYFRQLLLAQDQFELQRQRAQEDYHEQRMYQEQDYQLSRERAEESFSRMRNRSVANFHRQQERAYYQYNLSRSRAEEDFNHQVQVQAKQQAMSVYDIYERVQSERTNSIEWIVANAKDQVRRINEQTANLDVLRGRGVTDTAIQQMGLTDPAKAQQLARIVSETAGAQGADIIAQINAVTMEKVRGSKDLVTDESSLSWQETERGFRKSMTRGAEDFELQMKQSKEDFNRGLREQRTDFNIMMEQQQTDYEKGMHRQEKAYKKSMDRSAEDMANMANEVLLSVEDVLSQSMSRLTGAAQEQATAVSKSIKHLKHSTKPEAVALMQDLSAIFGFEYTVPKGARSDPSADTMTTPGGKEIPIPHADGGVLSGWSPGRDDRMVSVSGGEAIMRPEWARKVGKENIDAMNHAAKHGGFADGGIPAAGEWTQHSTSQYPWARWAGDINIPGSSDYGDPVRAWKAGVVAAVTYLGDRSYGRYIRINHPETNEETLYAHLSAATVKGGDQVTRGQQIGNVGDLGNASGPHLHFEIKGGTSPIVIGGGGGGGLLTQISQQVQAMTALKKLYPKSEDAAWEMDGVHPLGPGQISKVINRLARKKIKSLLGQGLTPGLSDTPEGIPPAPEGLSSNQETVQKAMLAAGYGQGQWDALYQLVTHESGFNNLAQNPSSTAYGMFQFLDSTWAGVDGKKTSDPWLQAVYGMRYIKNRYKNPKKAWDFWQDNNWYGEGAVFDGAQTIGVGESGPEAVIPLNDQGLGFMANVMARSVGMGSSPMAGGNTYNTKIDKSTTFSGPITVQANNPEELITKLQQRQRVMALSRPSLTGSAA